MTNSPNFLSIAHEFERKILNIYKNIQPHIKVRVDEILIKDSEALIHVYQHMWKIKITSYTGPEYLLSGSVNTVRVDTTIGEEYISDLLVKKYMELRE